MCYGPVPASCRRRREGGTLSCAPSADAVAGNGAALSCGPSAHAVAGNALILLTQGSFDLVLQGRQRFTDAYGIHRAALQTPIGPGQVRSIRRILLARQSQIRRRGD